MISRVYITSCGRQASPLQNPRGLCFYFPSGAVHKLHSETILTTDTTHWRVCQLVWPKQQGRIYHGLSLLQSPCLLQALPTAGSLSVTQDLGEECVATRTQALCLLLCGADAKCSDLSFSAEQIPAQHRYWTPKGSTEAVSS